MATLLLIAKVLSRKTKQNYGRLCFLVCIAASNLSMEEIEEGLCRERERERERETCSGGRMYNFFGFKNKYGMY